MMNTMRCHRDTDQNVSIDSWYRGSELTTKCDDHTKRVWWLVWTRVERKSAGKRIMIAVMWAIIFSFYHVFLLLSLCLFYFNYLQHVAFNWARAAEIQTMSFRRGSQADELIRADDCYFHRFMTACHAVRITGAATTVTFIIITACDIMTLWWQEIVPWNSNN